MDAPSSTCDTERVNALLIVGSVFVGIAAALHVLFFYFESVIWTRPSTWKRFGVRTQEDAETTKPMAYNQGWYNLFLSIGVFTGIVLMVTGNIAVGATLALFGALSMVAAATVLITSNPKLARSALIQGGAPLLGSILLIAGLASA